MGASCDEVGWREGGGGVGGFSLPSGLLALRRLHLTGCIDGWCDLFTDSIQPLLLLLLLSLLLVSLLLLLLE